MRRLVFFSVCCLFFGLLCAEPQYLLAIPTSSLKATELRSAVCDLASEGLDIYYYNENYLIAGSSSPEYPQAILLCQNNSARLYLLTKLDNVQDAKIAHAGRVLLDLGSSLLLQTDFDEKSLRSKLPHPFVRIGLSPLRLSQQEQSSGKPEAVRTDIQTLISHVNADSVLATIQTLQDFQTRYAFVDNRLAISTWIMEQFQRFGLNSAYLQTYDFQGYTHYNPVAILNGSVYPDEYIVVGGHHDSITYDEPMLFAPGADDNASGSAAAIEMARVMLLTGYQPKCSIVFTTFSAEEVGHWGSLVYAQHALNTNMDIRLMINHDMIANNSTGNTFAKLMPYDGCMEHSLKAVQIMNQYTSLQGILGYMNATGSDSHSFWHNGFNTIFFNENNFSPWYHGNNDTTIHLDPWYCSQIIKASTAVTAIYSQMPSVPSNISVWDTGTGDALTVYWDPAPDPLVDHYTVYYGSDEYSPAFSQITVSNQAIITGLPEGELCYVAVCAVDNCGTESMRIHSSGTPYLAPRIPVNLVDISLENAIQLSWTANQELDMDGYMLFRSLSADELGACIATIAHPDTVYTDSNLPGLQQYYCYRLCAVDNQGQQSDFTAVLQSRPITLDLGILVIDETTDFSGVNPLQPTDLMVDSFYTDMLEGFTEIAHLDLEAQLVPLRIADIGVYSSLLWHGNDTADFSYPHDIRNSLRQYIQMGGNVLFSLYYPSKAFELSSGYPAAFDENTLINSVLGISASNYNGLARFKYALSNMGGFPSLEVDSLKTMQILSGHIFQVESINPQSSAECVYCYGSDYADNTPQGCLNGQAVGVLHQYGLGKVLCLSFPLYNMQEAAAKALVQHVFGNLFNEASSVPETSLAPLSRLQIEPNYPNPFVNNTSFTVHCKDSIKELKVSIYNLRGQVVKTLHQGCPRQGKQYSWNGMDEQGTKAASGIYIISVKQAGQTQSRKILLLK